MKLLSVIAGAAFFTTSFGAPTAANNVLKGRAPPAPPGPPPPPPQPPQPPPSEAEVSSHLKSIERDTCLFYSRVGSEDDIKRRRDDRDYLRGYEILKERWTDQNWPIEAKDRMPPGQPGKNRKFIEIASRVLARGCSGTVYVLLPADTSGTNWETDTVWHQHEWPHLPPVVTKVVRLKMDDATYMEVIWGSSSKRNVAPIQARTANDKCAISLNQCDNGRTDGPGDRFDLEFDVHNDKGVILGHQARVSVGDWNPLRLLGSSLLTGIIVIPNGDSVGFWYLGRYWSTNDSRCKLGNWVDDANNARHREINCDFDC
jgi:hypothetical protein